MTSEKLLLLKIRIYGGLANQIIGGIMEWRDYEKINAKRRKRSRFKPDSDYIQEQISAFKERGGQIQKLDKQENSFDSINSQSVENRLSSIINVRCLK